MRLALVAWLAALMPVVAIGADTTPSLIAGSQIASGSNAVASGDWPAARDAYLAAVQSAARDGDIAAQVAARVELAKTLLVLGAPVRALWEYGTVGDLYRGIGDPISAAVADLLAARVLVDLDRFDDAIRILVAARAVDPDPGRRGEGDHLRVVAFERRGDSEAARAVVLDSRQSLPIGVWNRHLRVDALRLGVLQGDRRWGNVALWLLAIALWFAFAVVFWKRRRAEIALTGVAFFVAVGVVELTLRVVIPAPTEVRHVLHPPSSSTVFRPERGVMPGINYTESRFTINAAGLRGSEIPGKRTVRILAIGGSTTEAIFLDDADAWPAVLERELRQRHGRDVWVGNAGKSGMTTFAHLSALRAFAPELMPAVVVMQVGINDLTLCISGGRNDVRDNAARFRWPDAWDTYGQGVFFEIRSPTPSSSLRLQTVVDRVFSARTPNTLPVAARTFVQQDNAGAYYRILRRHRASAEKVADAPNISDCLIAFEANLRRIVELSASSGARLVLVTQGALYRHDLSAADESLLWFGSVDRSLFDIVPPKRYYTAGALADALARYNAVTLRVCAEAKVTCVDADTILPRTTDNYYDDVHMNVTGSRALGEALAARLAADGVI